MPALPAKISRLSPLAHRLTRLESLLGYLTPITPESVKTSDSSLSKPSLTTIECTRFSEVIDSWNDALQWTEGLETSLAVMLSSVTSTTLLGDQLWVKIIGPASCGKTTLCEALAVDDKHIKSVSTFRGFHSGYGDGKEDYSLISKLPNKTLLTKDGDTLLQSPNLEQILSEGRDAYDCATRTSYRNRASKDYIGVRFSWILCGTASLRTIDKSELGQRFLDCVVMENIDDDLEDRILMQVVERVERVLTQEDDTKREQYEPKLKLAMQMTGGYVTWLRKNVSMEIGKVSMSTESKYTCTRFAKFVSYLRARPSEKQPDENTTRELGARLASQHTKLALCLCVVLNKTHVDDEIIDKVRKVAMDTARGHSYDIADVLYRAVNGLELRGIALYTNKSDDVTRKMLRYMKFLGCVETIVEGTSGSLGGSKTKWKLSVKFRKLFHEATQIQDV